jgi:SAM-dependent methyltransferase
MSTNPPENKKPEQLTPAKPAPEETTLILDNLKPPMNGESQKVVAPAVATPATLVPAPVADSAANSAKQPAAETVSDKTVVHMEPVTVTPKQDAAPATPAAPAMPAAPAAPASATDDTLPKKSSSAEQRIASASPVMSAPPQLSMEEPSSADIENPYILSGAVDRARLVAQTRLFRSYVEKNAKQFVGENIKSILDIGCGEGQLSLVFARLFPEAKVIGVDKDERAIEAAQRAAKGMPNVEFQVGDILQSLPAGPFDLVYESLVLMHIPGTKQIIKSVYDVLKPGGLLWTKDLHPNMETAVDHPAFARLSKWMGTAMDRIGAPWRIGGELAPILTDARFKIIRTEEETYTLGTRSTEERITMAINLGAIYNARKLMTRVLQVPEIEMENAYKEIVAAMMAPNGPRGNFTYMNVISQRPETPQ